MNHYSSLWTDYDRKTEPTCVGAWNIRSQSRLANATKGDVLWLFTSWGKYRKKRVKPKLKIKHGDNLAYLIEVFVVSHIENTNDNRFLRVVGEKGKCLCLHSPILIDSIVRPEGRTTELPIGTYRQGAWKLQVNIAERLQQELEAHSPTTYAKVFG